MPPRSKPVKKTHLRPKTKVISVEPESPPVQPPVQTNPVPASEVAPLAVSSQPSPEVITPSSPQGSTAPLTSPLTETQSIAPPVTVPASNPVAQTAFNEVQQLASIPTESTTQTTSASPLKNRLPWVILISLLILAVGLAAWAAYDSLSKSQQIKPAVQNPQPTLATATPTSMPATPSPSPALSRKNLKIQILNGSGVPGAAKVAQKKLKTMGYEDITIGNADSYNFDKVEISLKKDKMNYFDLLVSDLGPAYAVASTAATLTSGHPYDVVIVIGQQ